MNTTIYGWCDYSSNWEFFFAYRSVIYNQEFKYGVKTLIYNDSS